MSVITRSKSIKKYRINIFYKYTNKYKLRNIKLTGNWKWVAGGMCLDDCDYPKDETFEGNYNDKNENLIKIINELNHDDFFAIDVQQIF